MPQDINDITVIMATYNGSKYLEAQMESIIGQSHKPYRIRVFDDVSSDNTLQLLKTYEKRTNIEVIQRPQNLGVIRNLKAALATIDGPEYIALADQDDVWLPQKLEISLGALKEIDIDPKKPALVYSDLMVIDQAGQHVSDSFWEILGLSKYQHVLSTLVYGNVVTGCASLMNAALLPYAQDIPEDLSTYHDAWLALCAFCFGKVKTIKTPLIQYRLHPENLTFYSSDVPKIKDRIKTHWRLLTRKDKFMQEQFALIERFLKVYNSQLKEEDRRVLKRFLSSRNKSYIQQKMIMRSTFKPYWLKK